MPQPGTTENNSAVGYRQLRQNADTQAARSILDEAEKEGLSVGAAAVRLINEGAFATTEAGWRAAYEGNDDLQSEFLTADDYCGWRRFQQRGGRA